MCPSSQDACHSLWNHIAGTNDPTQIDEAFAVLDRDGDGEIGPSDLISFFRFSVGDSITDEEIQSMIAVADLDGDGFVDLQEFHSLMSIGMEKTATPMTKAESSALRDMFHIMDLNGDGVLCTDDLKGAMDLFGQPISKEELEEMMQAAGGSRQALISFEDFAKLLSTL